MKKLAFLGALFLLVLSFNTAHADTVPTSCQPGDNFSSTTGQPCNAPSTCAPGDLYSSQTGLPCSNTYLPGCTSLIGYSVTTGSKCDGTTSLSQISQQLSQIALNTMPPQNTSSSVLIPSPATSVVENTPADLTALNAAKSTAQGLIAALPASHPYRNLKLSATTFADMQDALTKSTATSATDQQTVDTQTTTLNNAITAYNAALQEVSASTVTVTKTSTNIILTITYPDNTVDNIAFTDMDGFSNLVQIGNQYVLENNITNPLVINQ